MTNEPQAPRTQPDQPDALAQPSRRLDAPLLVDAFGLAARVHATQVRKGSQTPYLAHLLAVTSLVWSHEGTDVEAAAALLHDVVEDGGGAPILDEIRTSCGDEVATIVKGRIPVSPGRWQRAEERSMRVHVKGLLRSADGRASAVTPETRPKSALVLTSNDIAPPRIPPPSSRPHPRSSSRQPSLPTALRPRRRQRGLQSRAPRTVTGRLQINGGRASQHSGNTGTSTSTRSER